MQVSVRRVAPLSSEEDAEVQGAYRIDFTVETSSLSKQKIAAMALDIFHSQVAITVLDDFLIAVYDRKRQIEADPDHESYSASNAGNASKVSEIPLYEFGEDTGLEADELRQRYNPDSNASAGHPHFQRADWTGEVPEFSINYDYWDWVADQLPSASHPSGRSVIPN